MLFLQPLDTVVSLVDEHNLVGFCISFTELEKERHTSNKDQAINPKFKCDEFSYMGTSESIMKRHTTMKH